MKKILLILLLGLSGCGFVKYSTTLTLPDGNKINLESNVPSSAEGNGYKIDQRGLTIMEKLIPQNIRIDK
jgi:hypothetical protein